MQRRESGRWWGGGAHTKYTIVVFVLLASLDNAAFALYAGLVKVISIDLGVSEGRIGLITGTLILVTAITAVGWGYWGDRSSRKRLLFWGTIIWASGLAMAGQSESFGALFAWSAFLAIGLGSIASVGFSVISDFVSPKRRGLAMSFWGLSQGAGGIIGLVVGGLLGGENWRTPFFAIAAAGGVLALVYLTTYDAERGRAEPELAEAFAAGNGYEYQIEASDVPILLTKQTNRWLIIQGFFAQIAYGSLIWVPLLYQGKVLAEGYDLETAVAVGAIFGAVFQLGGITSIAAGHIGDRMQERNGRARALISAVGILGAIPFFIAFFFVPLTGLDIPVDEGRGSLVLATLGSIFTNGYAATAFVLSLVAVTLTGADSPNWFAMISDVNLPEHRGTIFGIGNLSNGVGRSIGNGLTGFAANVLARTYAEPLNFAVGLAIFQIFFLPTGYCYWRASKTCESDSAAVRAQLGERGRMAIEAE